MLKFCVYNTDTQQIEFGPDAALSGGTYQLSNIKDPVNPQDAATKAYVDAHAAGGGGSGVLANLQLGQTGLAGAAGKIGLFSANFASGPSEGLVGINSAGSSFAIRNSSSSGTAAAQLDICPISIANNGTYDYDAGSGGSMLVSIPGAASCPMVHIGFAANGATSLNGVTPAGGISLTQDNAGTVNIYASGSKVRFQNKVGSTVNVMILAARFGTA